MPLLSINGRMASHGFSIGSLIRQQKAHVQFAMRQNQMGTNLSESRLWFTVSLKLKIITNFYLSSWIWFKQCGWKEHKPIKGGKSLTICVEGGADLRWCLELPDESLLLIALLNNTSSSHFGLLCPYLNTRNKNRPRLLILLLINCSFSGD